MNTRTTIPEERLDLKVEDEVDFFRKPQSKDAPGWHGPATVVDISKVSRGIVTVRHQNRPFEVALSDVKKHLHIWVFMAAYTGSIHTNVWQHIRKTVENLPYGKLVHVGHARQSVDGQSTETDSWKRSPNNSHQTSLISAIKFFAGSHLHLDNVNAARMGTGLRALPSIKRYTSAVVIAWRPGTQYTQYVNMVATGENWVAGFRPTESIEDWRNSRVLQLLMTDDVVSLAEINKPGSNLQPAEAPRAEQNIPERLSTITEGSNETDVSASSLAAFFSQDNPKLQRSWIMLSLRQQTCWNLCREKQKSRPMATQSTACP